MSRTVRAERPSRRGGSGLVARVLSACVLALSLHASAADKWHTWLDCDFDDWPITARGEAGSLEVGDMASALGLWKTIGGLPLPQVVPDPAGRKGRSIMLTRRMGVPPFCVQRHPRFTKGKVEIEYRAYYKDSIYTSLFLFAVDLGNGKRDAAISVRFGTGRIRYLRQGEWRDTESRVLPGRWTRVRLLLDFDANAYSVFLGEGREPLARGVPLSGRYRPMMLQFICAEATGQVCIDDVKIRATAPPVVPPAHKTIHITKKSGLPADTALPKIFDAANPKSRVPSLAELSSGLDRWAESRPGCLTVKTVGSSRRGRPIRLCSVTDRGVAAQNKQRVLITASRGPEKNATVLILALLKWLLGDDPLAVETRRRQEVYLMPCNDPDGYEREQESEAFAEDLIWTGPREPERYPAGAALMKRITEIQPEVHVDVRSFDATRNAMISESFGVDFDSATARSYVDGIPHLMNLAAERAGFSCLSGEVGDGKIRATAPVSRLADHHYYQRRHKIVVPSLAYYHCHSIAFTAQMAFQESFLAGMKALFAVGNRGRPWRLERYPGYPVNHMNVVLTAGFGAWGATPVQRRRSRVELWGRMDQISVAEPGYGLIGGRALIFSSDPEQMKRLMSKGIHLPGGAYLVPWLNFVAALRKEEAAAHFDLEAAHRMVCERHKPSVGMYFSMGQGAPARQDDVIRHGLALQVYLPFPQATIKEIRLDGHPIGESPTDGYTVYHNPGTAVEVSIPPGKVRPLHILTLLYDGGLKRREGFAREDWKLR